VEINRLAAEILGKTGVKVFYGSIEEVDIQEKYDLVLTKGVLIHINPDNLAAVYQKMYSTSARWILTIEYYSRKADEVLYRGHQGVLFKRDFAGELMDKFGSGLKLIDYGFVYHRDTFPQDDLTWFLLEKTHP
jgi:spore coat polysaccharide biosynthesis protein SpsF